MKLRMIRNGDHGPDVKAVQEGLNKYYKARVLAPDGKFGGNTDRVVRQFQGEKGMTPPDGIVGPITRSALFPLVGITVNFWGMRANTADTTPGKRFLSPGALPPPRLQTVTQTPLGGLTPPRLTLTLPTGVPPGTPQTDMIQPPGLPDAVSVPKVAIPPGGRIVVDWQQIAQTQRQFDGLFKNQQDSFAIGWQSVFKRRLLDDKASHGEIATGCLLQSPIGFQDGRKNDFTIACFAQATWVESLGRAGIFAWAPYVQVQGQGNATGPVEATGSVSGFPIDFNVDLGPLGFDDVTLQLGAGAIGSLKFTPQGLKTTWGPQFGVGLSGKIWLLGQ